MSKSQNDAKTVEGNINFEGIVDRLNELEAQLAANAPEALEKARKLSSEILDPRFADRDEIWTRVWDKPLYANAQSGTGEMWGEKLKPYMDEALLTWGKEGGDFCIEREGGHHICANDSYKNNNGLPKKVREDTGIAWYRLYYIQNAACGMRSFPEHRPFAQFADKPLSKTVRTLRRTLGVGWGQVTTMHLLTDLGMAVKPDRHLVRTCKELGLIDDFDVPSSGELKVAQTDTLNDRVKEICRTKYGEYTSQNLRYVDKLLMEISSQTANSQTSCRGA